MPGVQWLGIQCLLTREGQQSLSQRRRAAHALHRRIGKPYQARGIIGQAARQQFDIAADHREVVVEVVRDAAGQPAHRLHLLRVAQCILGLLAPADFGLQRR